MSAQLAEEAGEQSGAFFLAHPGAHFGHVQGTGSTQDIDKRAARARLRFESTKDHGSHTGTLDGPGAHRARFEGDHKFAAF